MGPARSCSDIRIQNAGRGASIRSNGFARAIQSAPQSGNLEGIGIDGVRRLYSYAQLSWAAQAEPRYVRIGEPTAVVYAAADRKLRQDLVLLAVAAVVALMIAWWAGGLLVIRPLGPLLHAASALQEGDLSVRTGPPYVSGELGQLALAFDGMASALAVREAERQQAEAEVRALNAGLERRVAERTEQLEEANKALTRYAEEQSTLYGVSAAIAGTLEPQGLLSAVLDIVLAALGADAGWVIVADRVMGPQRRVPVWKGVPEEFIRAEAEVPPETCPVCDLLKERGQPCCEPQVSRTCPRLSPVIMATAALHSHVTLPLVSGEKVLGILNIGWHCEHTLSSADRALLATIGQQLSVALEKAELYAAASRRARRLAVINGIGQALTATLDLERVLDALLESIMPAVEADAAGVALVEENEEQEMDQRGNAPAGNGEPALVYRKAAGPGAEEIIGRRTGLADSLAAEALATQKPVLRRSPAIGDAASWQDGRLQGGDLVCLPLIVGERIIGVFELAKRRPTGLDEEGPATLGGRIDAGGCRHRERSALPAAARPIPAAGRVTGTIGPGREERRSGRAGCRAGARDQQPPAVAARSRRNGCRFPAQAPGASRMSPRGPRGDRAPE